jgi:F-type H+-transporting ATPase subunit a
MLTGLDGVLAQREGFHGPTTEEFFWPCIGPDLRLFGLDACVNRVVLLTFVAMLGVAVFFLWAFRRPQLVPRRRAQNLAEIGVDFIRNNIVLEVIGREGLRFVPYLTSIFFFIFFGNLLSVIPGVNFSPNSRSAVPAMLAVLSWLIFNYAGVKAQGLGPYLRNSLFPPGVPWPIYFLVTPIELVSTFLVRPLTLTIRLTANMIAGHLILVVFLVGTAYMLEPLISEGAPSITNLWAVGSFAFAIVLLGFEMFVAALQAFIFTILTATYIAGALESEH